MDLEKLKKSYGQNCLGQVIRIISEKEVIIDVGDNYLTIGDKIIIYTVGDEIFDLENNSLGIYEYNKAVLEVVSTTPSYSICETLKSKKVTSSLIDYTNIFTKETIEQDNLNVNKNDIEPIFIENKNIILKGDLVKKY